MQLEERGVPRAPVQRDQGWMSDACSTGRGIATRPQAPCFCSAAAQEPRPSLTRSRTTSGSA